MAKYFLVGVSYFIGEADTALQTNTFSCATNAKGTFAGQNPADGVSLVVNCPAGCAARVADKVFTSVAGEYLWTSSVCRSAMHAGMLGDAGGPVQLTLKTGSGENREWLQSELLAVLWGCWLLCPTCTSETLALVRKQAPSSHRDFMHFSLMGARAPCSFTRRHKPGRDLRDWGPDHRYCRQLGHDAAGRQPAPQPRHHFLRRATLGRLRPGGICAGHKAGAACGPVPGSVPYS